MVDGTWTWKVDMASVVYYKTFRFTDNIDNSGVFKLHKICSFGVTHWKHFALSMLLLLLLNSLY